MNGPNIMDLSRHFAVTTANKISKIVAPLIDYFQIKHFRYLKLYNNGSRIILSNYPDCTKFIYELGHYKKMWFDGEHAQQLKEGWHTWDVMRAINCGNEISPFEKEINNVLGLFYGMTYVVKGIGFVEIYTFDSEYANVYQIEYMLLQQFILYFKEQAKKIIEQGEHEKIDIKFQKSLSKYDLNIEQEKISAMLKKFKVNRYYLGGKYQNVYLTAKEMRCAYWLTQGKSAEEISIIDDSCQKTVLCHFESIRKKLNCHKQTQIVRILLEIGILNSTNEIY